jgi:hypothetical protein
MPEQPNTGKKANNPVNENQGEIPKGRRPEMTTAGDPQPVTYVSLLSASEEALSDEDREQLKSYESQLAGVKKFDFNAYKTFIDRLLSCDYREREDELMTRQDKQWIRSFSMLHSSQAYDLIRFATERYVRSRMNIPFMSQPSTLPKNLIEVVLEQVDAIGNSDEMECREPQPGCELIWNYWHEEGMLVQTMNAIAMRFQNIKNGINDPLAHMEMDPLRPIGNILWGYIQNAQHRLTVTRRAYEYDHHYGLHLIGKAVPELNSADSRSEFIGAFNNLLYKCTVFYKDVDDRTRRADAFPIFNALREVHRQLTEGMHNQYSDLPVTARVEMLVEQYILSRQEIWEFLRGRAMVIYNQAWMGAVDSMKSLQGWSKTSVSYYNDLAELGESILLSIRFTPWTTNNVITANASAWARSFRDKIQQYIHAYQVVTGVDLSQDSFETSETLKSAMPSLLMQRKLEKDRLMKRVI